MTLPDLIEEYKKMVSNCYNINYSDKKSIKFNNKSATRMYEIVDKIKAEFDDEGVFEFAKLINVTQNRVDLWASIQMLEKMQVDKDIEEKALAIIKEEAKGSLGLQHWLKSYQSKNKGGR